MKELNLETVADGAAKELFAREMAAVSENIYDQNTGAKAKRKITMTFEFEPDESRDEVRVVVQAKSTLAPVKAVTKTAHVGKRNGKVTLFAQDTKQVDMFDEETGIAKLEKRDKREVRA